MENFHLSLVYCFNVGCRLPMKAGEGCLAQRGASELGREAEPCRTPRVRPGTDPVWSLQSPCATGAWFVRGASPTVPAAPGLCIYLVPRALPHLPQLHAHRESPVLLALQNSEGSKQAAPGPSAIQASPRCPRACLSPGLPREAVWRGSATSGLGGSPVSLDYGSA